MGSNDDTDERHVRDGIDEGELPPGTDATGSSEPGGERSTGPTDESTESTDHPSAPAAADRDGVAAGAVDEVDARIVDLLSWILDTETRAKIYVYLLANPGSTSEEIATGTGLYPSTVREALAELHEEERVGREKRASEGAGNNPYEYTAIQPSELVGGVVDQVQRELNTIFTLDRVLDRGADGHLDEGVEPVTITVEDEGDGDAGPGSPPDGDTGRSADADAPPGIDDRPAGRTDGDEADGNTDERI